MAHKKLCKTLKILAGAAGIAFVGMQLVAKKKKADYTYKNEPEEQNPFEGKKVVFVKNDNDAENADGALQRPSSEIPVRPSRKAEEADPRKNHRRLRNHREC